jgi:hypothetical protein
LIGILSLIPALLLGMAGVLGLAGILADVGPAENRNFGWQAIYFAMPFVAISLASMAAVLFLVGKRDPRRDD